MTMRKIPKNVFILGLVSFFNDFASEMIYPIVPIFLTSVLHTSIPIVGLIEGIAEALASVSKYIFGTVSDYFQKRKIFVVSGYSFSALAKILLGLSYSWPLVLFSRVIDRLGKGLRTAPRDSILLENTTPQNKGFIFGFHRAFDSLGAVFGPLAALVVLVYVLYNLSQTLFATPAGYLADKLGARKIFLAGLLVFSVVYFFFGFLKETFWLWILFPVYGIYIAATDGVSKSYIAEFITKRESGTYFGIYYTLNAIGTFLASFIGGILWTKFSPSATFYYGSILSLTALVVFFVSHSFVSTRL